MRKTVGVLPPLIVAMAACGSGSLTGPSPVPSLPPPIEPVPAPRTVTATDYWPIVPGSRWTFRNQASGALTVIEATADGNSLVFTKDDPATYWEPGQNINLLWGVTSGPEGIYASDPRGRWDAVDDYPDDVRTDRDTGQIVSRTWYVSRDGRIPYMLLPASIVLPSEHHGLQRYYTVRSWGSRWSEDISWNVRYAWSTRKGDTGILRVMFDEYVQNPYHEDWYFERGYGPVRIEQWLDAERTSLKLRIERTQ